MCNCGPEVKIREYQNTVAVPIPPHMASYREARARAGLSPMVGIDRCILPEIEYLWSLGVHTHGSCCGHNVAATMINVREEDDAFMVEMGYIRWPNIPEGFCQQTFFARTIVMGECGAVLSADPSTPGAADPADGGYSVHEAITRQLAQEKPGGLAASAATRILVAIADAGFSIRRASRDSRPSRPAEAPAEAEQKPCPKCLDLQRRQVCGMCADCWRKAQTKKVPAEPQGARDLLALADNAIAWADKCMLYGPSDAAREAMRKYQEARAEAQEGRNT